MKQLRHILLLLPFLALLGCQDDQLLEDASTHPSGTVNYRFMASIGEEIPQTRVSLDPDSHGHGEEHLHNLALHWEEGDVVELIPADDATRHYTFTAVKYIYDTATGQFVSTPGESTQDMFIFESTDTDIPNPFTGTAVYKASRYPMPIHREVYQKMKSDETMDIQESGPVFQQSSDGDTNHLKCCQTMSATLTNVDLKLGANEWATISDIKHPIIFEADGEYAYLKVELNGFRYPICGIGKLFVYDMDEDSNDEDYRNSEYFTPLTTMDFGSAGNLFFSVPEKGDPGYDSTSDFDPYTDHYLGKTEKNCVLYVPLPTTTIQAGHYLAAVLQCGQSGDLYVFEKKVPFQMELRPGYLYTLDYSDRKPEYALCIIKNLTYLRSTFLGQNFEGEGATAPRYNLKGDEVKLNSATDPHNSNRFSEQDVAECGDDYLTAAEVKEMRNNHGAYYISGNSNKDNWDGRDGGSEMVSISPIKKAYWERWPEKDGDGGAWKFYNDGSATDASGVPYTSGTRKIVLTDILTIVDYQDTKEYMKKITKGVVNKESDYHVGNNSNCYEYVLKDKFDAVIKQGKTSLLWRTPYSRDVILPFSSLSSNIKANVKNNVIAIINTTSSHCIALPLLMEYYEDKVVRSTRFDGSGASNGTWKERALTSSVSTFRIFGSRSIRSFGGSNPAYFQIISAAINYGGTFSSTFCNSHNFDIALPVLPVFRWHCIKEKDSLIPWE